MYTLLLVYSTIGRNRILQVNTSMFKNIVILVVFKTHVFVRSRGKMSETLIRCTDVQCTPSDSCDKVNCLVFKAFYNFSQLHRKTCSKKIDQKVHLC